MKCHDCGGTARVTHTFQAAAGIRTRRICCSECRGVKVEIVLLLAEEKRGARKVATQIAKLGLEEALRKK